MSSPPVRSPAITAPGARPSVRNARPPPVAPTLAPPRTSAAPAPAAGPPGPGPAKADAERAPLEVLFEVVGARGLAPSAQTAGCSARMLEALQRLQGDKDATAVALEMISSVSMVVIGDAQKVTRLLADKKVDAGVGFAALHELGDMAAALARTTHEDVYDSVCRTIAGLRNVLHRGEQGH